MAVAEKGDVHVHYEDGPYGAGRVVSDQADVPCPYPGLAGFDQNQSRWFFGRDTLVAELIGLSAQSIDRGGLLMVVGPSGAGKSSVLRAGVLPAIARGALPPRRSTAWPRLVLTPTAYPQRALASRLASVVQRDPRVVLQLLSTQPDRLIDLLRTAVRVSCGGAQGRVLVVLDQLEELFTMCTDERQRRDFVDILARLAGRGRNGEPPVAVVLCGLRSDFYTPCADYPALRAALQRNQVFVGPMSPAELRAAILFPARDVGMRIEPGLVELLLADLKSALEGSAAGSAVGYEAGRLPLLAHALRMTWQLRRGRTLTVDGYRASGGIHRAVATTAERVFKALEPTAQQAARALFLQLVVIGVADDGIEDTRRRAARRELLHDRGNSDATRTALRAFTESRLITQEQDTVEITHEALLWAWPRFGDWLNADRAGNLVRQELETAARTWDEGDKEVTNLLRGSRLRTARAWIGSRRGNTNTVDVVPQLSGLAQDFLVASCRRRRLVRTGWAVTTSATAVALITAGVVIFAFGSQNSVLVQGQTVSAAEDLANRSESTVATDPKNSRLNSLAAYAIDHSSSAAAYAVENAAADHLLGVFSVEYSVTSMTLNEDGTVITLYDLGDSVGTLQIPSGHIAAHSQSSHQGATEDDTAARSRDHAIRAKRSTDGAVVVTNADTRKTQTIPPFGTQSSPLALSPDGQIAAVVDGDFDSEDGDQFELVDTQNLSVLDTFGVPKGDGIAYIAFSGNGHTIAIAIATDRGLDENQVYIWDLTPGRVTASLSIPDPILDDNTRIELGAQGKLVAMTNKSGSTLIHPFEGTGPQSLDLGGLPIEGMASSSDGTYMATLAGTDDPASGSVTVWDTRHLSTEKARVIPINSLNFKAATVALSADGHILAVGGRDEASNRSAVYYWNLNSPGTKPISKEVLESNLGPPGDLDDSYAVDIALSANGDRAAVNTATLGAGGPGALSFWDVRRNRTIRPSVYNNNKLLSIAMSLTGSYVATNSGSGLLQLWNPDSDTEVADQQIQTDLRNIRTLRFSDDARTLAVGGAWREQFH